jgi:hypothetical protein
MGSYGDRQLNCEWCGVAGQCLDMPSAAHLVSLVDVDPYGPLCDLCYDVRDRPPQYDYVAMVLRLRVGALPMATDLIAEFAYRHCGDFASWRRH